MTDIRQKLSAATRPQLLAYIASGIHGFTIMARDPEMAQTRRAEINNCIHYLAGRMIGLSNPSNACTDYDIDDVIAQVALLYPSLREGLLSRLDG